MSRSAIAAACGLVGVLAGVGWAGVSAGAPAAVGALLVAMAGVAVGAGVRSARLSERARADHLEAVRTFMAIVDATNAFTRGHSARVARLSVALGARLGLGRAALQELECAALLHDIGRTAVRLDILEKAGALSDRERAEVETHPRIGSDIVKRLGVFRGAAAIVLAHHERPDGRGYPNHLAGSDIPEGAGILHVAAAFDALTVDRPYRRGLSVDQALDEIRRHSGMQFEPDVVDALGDLHRTGALDADSGSTLDSAFPLRRSA